MPKLAETARPKEGASTEKCSRVKAGKGGTERKIENSHEALDDTPNGLAGAQACGIWRLIGVDLAPLGVCVPLDPEFRVCSSVGLCGSQRQPWDKLELESHSGLKAPGRQYHRRKLHRHTDGIRRPRCHKLQVPRMALSRTLNKECRSTRCHRY